MYHMTSDHDLWQHLSTASHAIFGEETVINTFICKNFAQRYSIGTAKPFVDVVFPKKYFKYELTTF